jgi:Protein of unknown function (DUF2541)
MSIYTHMTRRAWFLTMAVVVATAWTTQAQETQVARPKPGAAGQWRLIGTTEAGFSADHDQIIVKGADDFRRLKFKVTDADLTLVRMVVTYDNGEPDRIDIRQDIRQGGESRQIDLRGSGRRSIRKIEFWYDTKGVLKGRANVTVFGMK